MAEVKLPHLTPEEQRDYRQVGMVFPYAWAKDTLEKLNEAREEREKEHARAERGNGMILKLEKALEESNG